jgi:putative chitinase
MSGTDFKAALLQAFNDFGVPNGWLRAAIAAVVFGETGFQPRTEQGYANTSNDRIRMIFGSRVVHLSDDALSHLKANDELFFNFVYSSENFVGRELGNTQPGDGYLYRGRGGVQLTGRGNYTHMTVLTGLDLVNNPDLANVPENAAQIAVAYVLDHPHTDFETVKRAVGNAVATTEAAKDSAYASFVASGEWDATA